MWVEFTEILFHDKKKITFVKLKVTVFHVESIRKTRVKVEGVRKKIMEIMNIFQQSIIIYAAAITPDSAAHVSF